ncbi:MAG: peptidoglycan editing factor PgeF [Balneolales bacterium]
MRSEPKDLVDVIRPEIWNNGCGITAAFSTRHFGDGNKAFSMAYSEMARDSTVDYNRTVWLDHIGLKGIPLALGNQVHGSEVRTVTDSTFQADTDGLVTKQKNLALGILVADCAAVLLADRKAGVIAAVHAGWRGAVEGILEKAIFKMLLAGADVRETEAFISPCISLSAFESGGEVARLFPVQFVDYSTYDKPHIDLKKFINHELVKAGLRQNRIETNPLCTVSEGDKLHSFRRDKERSGRMMAVIAMQ